MPVDQNTYADTHKEERKELDIDVLVSLVVPFVDAMTLFTLGGAARSVRPLRQIAFALALTNSTTEGSDFHLDAFCWKLIIHKHNSTFSSNPLFAPLRNSRSARPKPRSFASTWLSLSVPVAAPDIATPPNSSLFDKSHSDAEQIADIVNETLQSSLSLHEALSTESLTTALLVLQARFRLDAPLTFLNLVSFSTHCATLMWRSNVELVVEQGPLFDPMSWGKFIGGITEDSNFPSNPKRSPNLRKLTVEGCWLGNNLFRLLVDVLHPTSSRKDHAIDCSELSTELSLATAEAARPSKYHPTQKPKKINLSTLNLNDNMLGDESLELISTRIIPVCHGLQCLELEGNRFTGVGIKAIAEKLPLCKISRLNLSFTNMSDESLTMLSGALPFSSIESLSLTENLLTDLGMRALAAHLDSSPVVHLDLSSNTGVRDEGLRLLSTALPNSNVTQLSLADCDIGFQGVYALTKVIQKTRINILKLCRNQRIGRNGVKYFCENAFQARGAKLTELHMHYVNAFDTGCNALSSSLPSQHCLLRVLDLRNNGITDDGAVSFQKHGLEKLQRLLLGQNRITDRGVKALSNALVASKSLVELNLVDNRVGGEGVEALESAVLEAKQTKPVKIEW
ncbi:RNA-DNA hybrid ribonuclease [Chytriomyces hyalinus]|nr:RNA-DNA hybrid ribonuclease [Chytriomyces hyalinus]